MASPETDRRRLVPGRLRHVSRPVLVTGVPRSGTTWLARELARAQGAGLAGREPMNPRSGQFALGGTLDGWVELEHPSPQQARLLRRCYSGREPRVLSRYGERQLQAALPWGTTVVKDPFALLSLPCIVALTQAVAVVVYRPAVAVLASYRRMGWQADTAEVRALPGGPSGPEPLGDVEAMAEFWTELHTRVLDRIEQVPGAVLVSHPDLVAGGEQGLDTLAARCGLGSRRSARRTTGAVARRAVVERGVAGPPSARDADRPQLHDFDRTAQAVAEGWRSRVEESERRWLDEATGTVWERLQAARTGLG